MSEHNEHHHHDHQEPESSSIKAKPILAFLGVLAVATAFVFVLIWGLLWAFDQRREADTTPPASRVELPDGQRKLPPEPRLQGAPAPEGPSLLPLDDWKVYKEMTDRQVASYGWVDKTTGVARIPIERAKELVAEQGLPLLSEKSIGDIERAEATRREVYAADSSAGRLLRAVASPAAPVAAVPATPAAPAPVAPAPASAPQH
ncbi:MAG: hypothetical protein RIR86_2169 [Acidobacteriota bacterium]|jgi:hypothetical protein